MIITEMCPLLGQDNGFSFHSRIVCSASIIHKDRTAGIRKMFQQEIPLVLAQIEQYQALRQLEITQGLTDAELDRIPIFTEAEVLLSGAANTSYFPLLNAQADKLKKERSEIAQGLITERSRIKHKLSNIGDEVDTYHWRLKTIEASANHEALDKLWQELNNELQRIRIVLNVIAKSGPSFTGVSDSRA